MKLILSSWGILEANIGEFRLMFMAMEAQALAEKRDTVCGLILPKISINTAFCGPIKQSCKKVQTLPKYSATFVYFFSTTKFVVLEC